MKKAVLFLVLAAMLVGSIPVLADGVFYWAEEENLVFVPAEDDEPYRKHIVRW